jgi:plasmid maintenance system antidote protein VapI
MSLRLLKCLGRSPESWLAMQHSHDLWLAKKSIDLSEVEALRPSAA